MRTYLLSLAVFAVALSIPVALMTWRAARQMKRSFDKAVADFDAQHAEVQAHIRRGARQTNGKII